MASSVTWLDTSVEEQRHMREILGQFSQQESRDELGIGQIRDVLSDALFPGTSVIQTRARYFLIVPWVFTAAAAQGRSGAPLRGRAETHERRLVEWLRDAGYTDGLIGLRAGSAVRILPSSIYWNGLRTFGILTHDASPDRLLGSTHPPDNTDELAARLVGDWVPTLPPAPDGFPWELEGGLDLTQDEATWLRDQVLVSVPGTLLAHLMTHPSAPSLDSTGPWADASCCAAPPDIMTLLADAERFSLALHGASLLYNLLLAERFEGAGYVNPQVAQPVALYTDLLADWSGLIDGAATALQEWDLPSFWTFVLGRNPRIGAPTRAFVDTWISAVRDGRAADAVNDPGLRSLVSEREQSIKRGQSRLTNDRLLAAWSGASGSARLVFRWPQVRRIVRDVHDGAARA